MNFSTSTISAAVNKTRVQSHAFEARQLSDVYRQVSAESHSPIVYVQPPTDCATLGVIDTFRVEQTDPPIHGDEVHAVALRHGLEPKDTARISSSIDHKTMSALASLLYGDLSQDFGQRLDAYIELTASQTLSKTNGILKQLASQPDLGLRTLNQSQGESRLGVYKLLLGAAWNGRKDGKPLITETGKKMSQACGYQPDQKNFSPWQFHQSLIDRVSGVVDNSEYIRGLQKEHANLVSQLADRGVAIVSSAGNDNDDFMETRNVYGHRLPENFDDDITSVGEKLIVGALDTKQTPDDPTDDEIAGFSSRYSAVSLLADGIDVPTLEGRTNTGSSFAAPQVAATMDKIRREKPDLTMQELKRETAGYFRATDGYNIL